MTDFPAHLFDLRGSPEAIAASAQQYQRFGQSAAQASGRIAAMDTGQFVGPEGDRFRQKLASDLPPHLRVTGTAFTHVARALMTFSSRLADLQAKMRPLEQQAPGLWEQVKAAEGRLHQAQSADQAHARAVQDQAAHAPAGQPPPPAAPYTSDAGGASASLSAAHQVWQECVDRATALRTEMIAAAQECARQIDDAKGMRFQDPPGSWDLIGQGRDFIREHKDDLKSVSDALKYVSAACAAIGLVLQAIPVVGNAVGAAFLAAGVVTGLASVGIDAGIYAATGEGNLTSILVDGALTVIPEGRVAKLADAETALARGGEAAGEASTTVEATAAEGVEAPKPGGVGRASFGHATTTDYKHTFFRAFPDTEGKVVVHHAVEQQTLRRYPGVVSESEMHSLENLRGIPKGEVNNKVHLSAIRKEWNRFYKANPNPTQEQLLEHATKIDDKYGHLFNPPIR